ncbi:mannose-6-phosphate isomerase [Pseudonocardia sp. GCM10023141]|uniref:mannose-6-phosphate isomerase n=1 Tax=Pseudonocardia sp. GCM10023141 TaxID=3252653 RepID=UPI00360DE4F0
MIPVELPPNLITHFYRGGANIAALRRTSTDNAFQPEEWLAATVGRMGETGTGLSRLATGELLRDLVIADPGRWVGPDHGARPDAGDVGVLVKLLDAGQRLPVHVHPDRAFARSHLDCPYGKTEAWFVLDADAAADGAVYLGWNSDVDRADLDRARDEQDSDWMLARMNRIPVSRGDGILVPAGTAHAIGAGVFVAEAQEPTDFSILLEWSITTATRDESHLGLGFDRVMPAVSLQRMEPDEIAALTLITDLDARSAEPISLLPAPADPFFRLALVAPAGAPVAVDAGFTVALVLAGTGTARGTGAIELAAGGLYAVPHAFGDWTVTGEVSLLLGRPGVGWPRTLGDPGGATVASSR